MEMVTTLTMLALMAAVSAPYLTTGVRAYNESTAAVRTLGKLRVTSERLVRELREIRRDPLAPANFDTTVGANPLVFTKNDGETVTISSAAPLLSLAYTSVASGTAFTLTDELSSINFSYLQSDGVSAATSSADVAFIEFELVLSHAGNSYAQRSRVALRNRP
jgi:hypothetical protein